MRPALQQNVMAPVTCMASRNLIARHYCPRRTISLASVVATRRHSPTSKWGPPGRSSWTSSKLTAAPQRFLSSSSILSTAAVSKPARCHTSSLRSPSPSIRNVGVHIRGVSTSQGETKAPSSATTNNTLVSRLSMPATRHENIYTLPNLLTFTRLIAAPAVGYFILHSQPFYALATFFYAGVTDAVDGYLARRYNQQTVVGTVIDPMADKLLMTIAVGCLAIQGAIPVWLAVVILGRDVGLAISAIYFRWISLPPPKTMRRYWDFSLPSAEVHPTEISKINTLLQLLLIGNAMLLPVLPEAIVSAYNLTGIFEGWSFLVAGTTIWSGLSYIGSNDAVKILTKEEGEERQRKLQQQASGNGKQ